MESEAVTPSKGESVRVCEQAQEQVRVKVGTSECICAKERHRWQALARAGGRIFFPQIQSFFDIMQSAYILIFIELVKKRERERR